PAHAKPDLRSAGPNTSYERESTEQVIASVASERDRSGHTSCRSGRQESMHMRTRAHIEVHPLHPMLIAFPVALYVTTLVTLLVHIATGEPFWYRAAMWANIAAVVMAVVAAIPGFIDLLGLPRRSRARSTGIRHAGFNVLSLV